MTIPEHLKYTPEHVWIDIVDDIATIGITDYFQNQIGEILYVVLPEIGVKISSTDIFTELESSRNNIEIPSPLSGEIIDVNDEIAESPEIINDDAYGSWICRIRLSDETEIDLLISASDYMDSVGL